MYLQENISSMHPCNLLHTYCIMTHPSIIPQTDTFQPKATAQATASRSKWKPVMHRHTLSIHNHSSNIQYSTVSYPLSIDDESFVYPLFTTHSLAARGAEMLARRLRGSSCVLMHLALGGNLMGDLGVSLLLTALEACGSCRTLEHLDLSNNSLAMSAGTVGPNQTQRQFDYSEVNPALSESNIALTHPLQSYR